MVKALQWILNYILKLLNASDHTADVVLLAYIATVTCDLVFLSHGIYKGRGFTPDWNQNFLILSGMVSLTKINNAWSTRAREQQDDGKAKDEGGPQ